MQRVVENFVCFICIVRKDDVGFNEVGLVNSSVIAKCERRVLNGCRDGSPYAKVCFVNAMIFG